MSLVFNVRHPRDFMSSTSRRGTLYTYHPPSLQASHQREETRDRNERVLPRGKWKPEFDSRIGHHNTNSLHHQHSGQKAMVLLIPRVGPACCMHTIFSPSADSHREGRVVTRRLHTMSRVKSSPSAINCLLYTSPSPRDQRGSRMPSSA